MEFTDAKAARKFLYANRDGFAEKQTRLAILVDQRHGGELSDARAMRLASSLLKAHPWRSKKLKAGALKPTRCQRCGCSLSDPESIAAGFGPECMEKMAG
jgi:hypothetical protein